MILNKIIVSQESFESENHYELIYSNIDNINKLLSTHIEEDRIHKDALKSYYVDSYLAQIIFGGFFTFLKEFENRPKKLYYIQRGLESMGAKKNLYLLQEVIQSKQNNCDYFKDFDRTFESIQYDENIIELHYKWLINHPKLEILNHDEIDDKLSKVINDFNFPQEHVKIMSKCESKLFTRHGRRYQQYLQ